MKPFSFECEMCDLVPTTAELSDYDRQRVVEACSDPVSQMYLPKLPSPYTLSDAEEFITRKVEDWEAGDILHWFIRERTTGLLAGSVEVRKNAAGDTIGLWVHPAERGKGYGLEAVTAVAKWAYENHYTASGLVEYAAVKGNVASAALAHRANFKFREWRNSKPAGTKTRHGEFYDYMVSEYAPNEIQQIQDNPALFANIRHGSGFDVHPFSNSRILKLGTLEFPEYSALKGHSDGDVVAHALADAILSALGAGDVGKIFGVADPQNAGISGAQILQKVRKLAEKQGFRVQNATVNIISEQPKISARREEMQTSLAALLFAPVGITASTGNHCLEFTKNSIAVNANVLLCG